MTIKTTSVVTELHDEDYVNITAEFSFSYSDRITASCKSKLEPGCLRKIVEESAVTFLAGAREIKVLVDPEDSNEIHLRLTYWHMDGEDFSHVQFEVSASECFVAGFAAGAVENLKSILVPRFVDILNKQGINLPS